jgi:hypothetical protein
MSQFPGSDYLITVIKRLKYYKDLAEKTFEQLNEAELHYSPGPESNSIQHMTGNMLSRWTHFLTEDGEKSWRNRDDEFEIHPYGKEQLINIWDEGWKCFLTTLDSLSETDLSKTVSIRGESLSVTDAINRQLAHYPYHIGQIVFIGRMLKKENWINLSIARGQSQQYNQSEGVKDPVKNFK